MITLIQDNDYLRKKNCDPYKDMFKLFAKSIKDMPLEDIVRIDTFFNQETYCHIGKIALLFYSHKEGKGFSNIKKELKTLYKETSLEVLIELYLLFSNIIIERTQVLKMYNEDIANLTRYKNQDSLDTYFNIEALVANISLMAIIMEHDLLNYNINCFKENNGSLQLLREIKKDKVSIIQHEPCKLMILLSSADTEKLLNATALIVQKSKSLESKFYPNITNEISILRENLTVNFYQELLSMMIYKDKYLKMREILNNNSFDKDLCSLNTKLLRSRKFLPPKNGVVLKMKNHKNIESVFFNEIDLSEERILTGTVRYVDKEEFVFSVNLSTNILHTFLVRDTEDVLSILFSFYGIEDDHNLQSRISTDDYEVLSPYYWKYRNNNYETNGEREIRLLGKKVKREYEIKVSSFVRKINGKPSQDSLNLAQRLCIELEPNTTIVKEHVRTYNKGIV